MTTGLDFDNAIQELVERVYETASVPKSRTEIRFLMPSSVHTDVDERQFLLVPEASYACALKFRIGDRPDEPVDIVDLASQYQHGQWSDSCFVDYGPLTVEDVRYRAYRLPQALEGSTDTIYAYVRIKTPEITSDEQELPIPSLALVKLGLLAIGHENENDLDKAQAFWEQFRFENEKTHQFHDGIKKSKLIFKEGFLRQPTNFR